MGSRLKEDEKNERVIRGLLKQPPNSKCINCNARGPQYVCITFSTFVCTTCGGIHREFTHRVKSISMAKFTPQEIASLQAGGNERAREIYFKEFDPQRQSTPDSSNVDRLRDFIRHVYVNKKYTGERSSDRPPQVKMGDKEEPNENRKSDGYRSGSRSPPYDDVYERRYSDRASPGYDVKRSPGYDQDNQRHSDYGRSPARTGVVNDWRREDRFANGRKSEDRRSSDGDFKAEIRSPDHQKDSTISSPPVVRPVRDILGDNVTPLKISEPPKINNSRAADGRTFNQRAASSSSLASSNGNPTELKRETSLIDFDAEPEPPVAAAATQAQQPTDSQSGVQSTSAASDDNWACFDNVPANKVSQAPPSSNPLESVLTQLSVPALVPISGSVNSSAAPTPSNGHPSSSGDLLFSSVRNASTAAAPAGFLPFPSGGASAVSGLQHQQQPFGQVAGSQPGAQSLDSFPSGSSSQGLTGNPAAQAPEAVPNPGAQTSEVKSSGRKELPADLFTAMYSSVPYQAQGWRAGMVPGMGYSMQYNPAMLQPMPSFPQPSKSANPFDVNAEAHPAQAAVFPSMSPLHAALPNMAPPRGLMHAPNLGTATPSWMPPQPSSYPSAGPPTAQSFGSAMPGYVGQQLPNNMAPPRPQGLGILSNEGNAFGSLNPAAATPNPSLGGNPFG